MRVLNDRPEVWPFILLSLVLHAIFFIFVPRFIPPTNFEEKPLEVFAVTPMNEPQQKMPYDIADIAEPAKQEKPKDARFLGQYDSTVNEETVGTTRKGTDGGDKGSTKKFKTVIGRTKPKPAKKPELSKDRLFAFNKDIFDDNRAQKSIEEEDKKSGSAKKAGGLDDFYPDFKRGSHTYLNVLRYEGVEYFVRMKHAFKITFNPEPSLRDHFTMNRITRGSIDVVLGVSVNRSGELSELFVFRSSGIPGYDEEALRTVRASAPFASPPDKFLADDGQLRMSWTFSVYL